MHDAKRFVECKHYEHPVVEGTAFQPHWKLGLRVKGNREMGKMIREDSVNF